MDKSIIKKVGTLPGKTIAIFAGIHGNERVGIHVIEKLDKELVVKLGTVFLVYANPPAIEADKRFIQKNINRLFSQDSVESEDDVYEDIRARELMKLLDGCNAVLDIHSYNSEEGGQFAFCEPNGYDIIEKMDFPIIASRNKPDPKLHSTTVMGYMNKTGIGICLECGTSNRAEQFVDLALKSSYQFLQYFGNIDMVVPYDNVSQRFIKNDRMLYKKNDAFRFVKDFKDFEPLPANEPFAFDGDETLIAGKNECIFFPRPNVPVGGEVCLIGILGEKYTLRTAQEKDAEFLFKVKIEAMMPTSSILRTEAFDYNKEFEEYLKKFEPEKIQVIQFEGKDIGRLRVVRSAESIYIGGVQILSEFQGKGIGTAIFNDVIAESEMSGIPVTLEVHQVNDKAISFYTKLGFKEAGKTEKQILMKYSPNSKL